MQDVDLLPIDHVQERGKRRRVEPGLVQVRDVDAERLQRFFRQILLAQAHEGHVIALGIEPGNHPREQPLDPVHPRPFPPEVIADLQHVHPTLSIGCLAEAAKRRRRTHRCPMTLAGIPTAMAPAGTGSRTTAPAPMTARSPTDTPSSTFAPAPSHAPAPTLIPIERRPCASTACVGSVK